MNTISAIQSPSQTHSRQPLLPLQLQIPRFFSTTHLPNHPLRRRIRRTLALSNNPLHLPIPPLPNRKDHDDDDDDDEEEETRAGAATAAAAAVGLALYVLFADKAMALGPEGPLMEEFWDNVRRYALYALTVSTGALYTILLPIWELLKNPVSAILVVVIFVGGFYVVSQVVSAMVGLSDFSYSYAY